MKPKETTPSTSGVIETNPFPTSNYAPLKDVAPAPAQPVPPSGKVNTNPFPMMNFAPYPKKFISFIFFSFIFFPPFRTTSSTGLPELKPLEPLKPLVTNSPSSYTPSAASSSYAPSYAPSSKKEQKFVEFLFLVVISHHLFFLFQ